MKDRPTPETEVAKFTHQDACIEGMRPERELVDAHFARTLPENAVTKGE